MYFIKALIDAVKVIIVMTRDDDFLAEMQDEQDVEQWEIKEGRLDPHG